MSDAAMYTLGPVEGAGHHDVAPQTWPCDAVKNPTMGGRLRGIYTFAPDIVAPDTHRRVGCAGHVFVSVEAAWR